MKTRQEVVALLQNDDTAVERAIFVLYHRQTEKERDGLFTYERNGRGFDQISARRGTTYGEWVDSGKKLSGASLNAARKIAVRHSRQMLEQINEEEREACYGLR